MRWLDGITESMDMSLSKLWRWWRTGRPGVCGVMKHTWCLCHKAGVTERLNSNDQWSPPPTSLLTLYFNYLFHFQSHLLNTKFLAFIGIFIGRSDAEAETPILWPPDMKNWLTGKDPDAGKDWRLEEKGATEDEMVGWHHWLNGHECEWTPGVGDEQGGLACCSPWDHKDLDMTEQLNWTEVPCRQGHLSFTHHFTLRAYS